MTEYTVGIEAQKRQRRHDGRYWSRTVCRAPWAVYHLPTLESWLSASESGSRAIRRIVTKWRRAHGWKLTMVLGGPNAKDEMVWRLPHPELQPYYLGGKKKVAPAISLYAPYSPIDKMPDKEYVPPAFLDRKVSDI